MSQPVLSHKSFTDAPAILLNHGIYMPFAGTGSAMTITGITQTRYAIVTFSGSHSFLPGAWCNIASVAGMTAINGFRQVRRIVSSTQVELDYDSSTKSAWTSGGTMTPNVVVDECGTAPNTAIGGSATGIWANPIYGLTANSAGSRLEFTGAIANKVFTGASDVFGWFVAFDLYITGIPSSSEGIFCLGNPNSSQTLSEYGTISIDCQNNGSGAAVQRLVYRGSGVGTESNVPTTFPGTHTLSTSRRLAAGILFNGDGTATQYLFVAGELARSDALAVGTGNPKWAGSTTVTGMAIGAKLTSTVGTLNSYLGLNASGARLNNFFMTSTPSLDQAGFSRLAYTINRDRGVARRAIREIMPDYL